MISGKTLSLSPRTKRKTPTLSEKLVIFFFNYRLHLLIHLSSPSPLRRFVPRRRKKSISKSKPASNVPTVVADVIVVGTAVETGVVIVVGIVVETSVVLVVLEPELLGVDVQMVLLPPSSMTRPPSLP